MKRGGSFPLKRSGAGGFTLLELIIVLMIIGIASALVVPRLVGGMGSLDVRTASGKVAASLRYARSQAVSQKINYTAVFDLQRKRLTIMPSSESAGEWDDDGADVEKKSAGIQGKTYDLPGRVAFERVPEGDVYMGDEEIDAGIFRIGFYPSGGSDGGEIALANERGRRYTVRVDIITGTVKVARGGSE
ncbi:MAG: prepilin-type N-terminal cleavage/methylation domain-containing protein [Thermodesulfobacteriota bacterium]|nr:prepilin-type N-terminal cleavage/methylation domain-containing protein [Thermodesulfobacteriota bacterium]